MEPLAKLIECTFAEAAAGYAGLTGSPDESGAKRREKGLARSGNARVRHGMIQLACRSADRAVALRQPG